MEGSNKESAFLHASWDFHEARLWYERAKVERKERNHYMVRIDVKKLQPWAILDLSKKKAFNPHILPYKDSERIQRVVWTMARAEAAKEVLLRWRGEIPYEAFERVDVSSGAVLGPLGEASTSYHGVPGTR